MECLNSFTIGIRQQSTFSGADVKTWLLGVQDYWAVDIIRTSTFNIQGFKNIDLYGIKMTGDVQTQVGAATGGVVVDDFGFDIYVDGSLPLISGAVDPGVNFWNLEVSNVGAKTFRLSRNQNEINFAAPIKSVKYFNFERLVAQGVAAQTAGTISLDYDLTFTFYYKYEGE